MYGRLLGDGKTNVADMFNRGRHWTQTDPNRAKAVGRRSGLSNTWHRGTGNPKAKLTEIQVTQIRMADGSSYQIAKRFGVNATTVQRIKNGAAWNY